MVQISPFVITKARFDSVIFDLDGVVTKTAAVHAAVWKQLFDEYRKERLSRNLPSFEPFDIESDYPEYVDGKSRYDGVRSFFESRAINLPYGSPEDPPEKETICGLANRKNRLFQRRLEREGVEVYDSTVRLIRDLRGRGFKVGIISASKNCSAVLRAAGLERLFDTQVDGIETARLNLKGKPAPDVFIEAAKRLRIEPKRAIVVEDAFAGVMAGRQGGFGLVVGVDRIGVADRLKELGADWVVSDLAEVELNEEASSVTGNTSDLPSAISRVKEILGGPRRSLAVFLDYDGTLTPIVSRPEDAVLDDAMRGALKRLVTKCIVAVISGRDLADVRERVGLDEIVYAGSHGFQIRGPGGLEKENKEAQAHLAALEEAESALRKSVNSILGCQIERKKYSIAIHFRNVDEKRVAEVERVVDLVARRHPNLRRSSGKKVFELQPNIDWHKGRAVVWLLEALDLNKTEVLPIYIGDDLTDEDAFEALRERGVGIVVRDEPRRTAARFALEDPQEVHEFLLLLITELDRRES